MKDHTQENSWFTDFKEFQESVDKPAKDSTNEFFNRHQYASFEACLEAIKPALHQHGFVLLQSNNRDELGDYTETKFVHKTGYELVTKVYLVLDKNNMQGVGSAITYAKRYGILTLAGIEPETKDDDDGNKASLPSGTTNNAAQGAPSKNNSGWPTRSQQQ